MFGHAVPGDRSSHRNGGAMRRESAQDRPACADNAAIELSILSALGLLQLAFWAWTT